MESNARDGLTHQHVDGSIPFGYLVGTHYSGYQQALRVGGNLQGRLSKLPKLFWRLSDEQRRQLATRMLKGGHSGAELERAIRLAIWEEGPSKRGIRVPEGKQPWDNPSNIEGGVHGIGLNGRPVSAQRYRPRQPFLAVEPGRLLFHGSDGRANKPQVRLDCAEARRRRDIQENMRARVQIQGEFLSGQELERREWRRFRTQILKNRAAANIQKMVRARLNYGNDQSDGTESETTSTHVAQDGRLERQELARAYKVARETQRQANRANARARRWENCIVKSIRAEATRTLQCEREKVLDLRDPDFVRALPSPDTKHALCSDPLGGLSARKAERREVIPTLLDTQRDPGASGVKLPKRGDGGTVATLWDIADACPIQAGGGPRFEDHGQAGGTRVAQSNRTYSPDDETLTTIEQVLQTSKSVAFAAAKPLRVQASPKLEVHDDPHLVNKKRIVARLRSRTQLSARPCRYDMHNPSTKGGGFKIHRRYDQEASGDDSGDDLSPSCRNASDKIKAGVLDLDALSQIARRPLSQDTCRGRRNAFAPMTSDELHDLLALAEGRSFCQVRID